MEALVIFAVGALSFASFLFRAAYNTRSGWLLTWACLGLVACAGFTVAAVYVGKAERAEEMRVHQQFAREMAPLIERLEYLEFKPPRGHELDDPSLYLFTDGNFNIGTVEVANKSGAAIKVRFEITSAGASVGCITEGDTYEPLGPFAAKIIRATNGCA